MPPPHRTAVATAAALALTVACSGPDAKADRVRVRLATFNTSLNRDAGGALAAELRAVSTQATAVARILRTLQPDVVVLQEFDFDAEGSALAQFRARYLGAASDDGTAPLALEHAWAGPVNTGVPSGMDLDGDGAIGGPGDAFGYGRHPGQYGMAVLSRFPIDVGAIRTFRELRWQDLPGHRMPHGFWPPQVAARIRLSSKSHQDVPIRLPDGRVLHLLISHPTPPAFDGPEGRNRRRNHDEIRFWAEYLDDAAWIVDDAGRRGGLDPDALFVICGDLNADPFDGGGLEPGIRLLLGHPRVQAEPAPASPGAIRAAGAQGSANAAHRGPAAHDTADFGDDPGPGNLRVDYLLPSRGIHRLGQGVFWPVPSDPDAGLLDASDHRPVWMDLR